VTASASGFNSQTLAATISTGLKTSVNFSLTSIAGVSGRVTDISTAKPIAGATVKLGALQTTSDVNGNYKLSAAAGDTVVTAAANGYFSASRTFSTSPGSTAVVNFQLATGGKVGGQVTNSSGAGLANAKVLINGGAVATSLTVTTNGSGNYNSNWIPVGSYSVTTTLGSSSKTLSTTVTTGTTTMANLSLP
jgi:uncharacterized membrane protein